MNFVTIWSLLIFFQQPNIKIQIHLKEKIIILDIHLHPSLEVVEVQQNQLWQSPNLSLKLMEVIHINQNVAHPYELVQKDKILHKLVSLLNLTISQQSLLKDPNQV